MTKQEIIKERIKVDMEKFKLYVIVMVALAGGLYALLIRLEDNILNKALFILGFLLLVVLVVGIIRINLNIKQYFKDLENFNTNV